jgi:hypothetical protein
LTSAVLRAAALAWVVVKYPNRAGELRNAAEAANRVALSVSQTAGHSAAALGATKAALATAMSIFAVASSNAANAANGALDATVGVSGNKYVWEEIQADVLAVQRLTAGSLVDLPLWLRAGPQWANIAWAELQALLPDRDNWDVWLDWYEQRLRGGSRGEAYELVFASVPQEEWDKGSAAANAWIKAHLPPVSPQQLPSPLENVPSIGTYSVNAAGKIAVVPGPQNIPAFPFPTSREDHQLWLTASRILVRRLVDDVNAKKFGNFPVERYRDYLVRYESDLPTEPGTGNFVLADFEARSLRALFAEEAQFLPSTLSSRLKSLLESHFALRACYPMVARMYEAINTGRLQEPPPFHEFERFTEAVAEYPERFEPEVLNGLEQISRGAAVVPKETELPATTAQFISPPPDPLTEPDPIKERAFSMAGAANNIVSAARKGAELGRTLDGWDKFLHTMHDAAAVAIEWLHHFH